MSLKRNKKSSTGILYFYSKSLPVEFDYSDAMYTPNAMVTMVCSTFNCNYTSAHPHKSVPLLSYFGHANAKRFQCGKVVQVTTASIYVSKFKEIFLCGCEMAGNWKIFQ